LFPNAIDREQIGARGDGAGRRGGRGLLLLRRLLRRRGLLPLRWLRLLRSDGRRKTGRDAQHGKNGSTNGSTHDPSDVPEDGTAGWSLVPGS
jgi:hypothetical protein